MRSIRRLHFKSLVKVLFYLLILSLVSVISYKSFKQSDQADTIDTDLYQRSGQRGNDNSDLARNESAVNKVPTGGDEQQINAPHHIDNSPSVKEKNIDVQGGAGFREHLDKLMEVIVSRKLPQSPHKDSKEKLKSYYSSLSRRFPRIMIVGFGKTGTRALFDTLKMHPMLTGPSSEKRFFSDHYEKGLWSYLKSLPDPPANGMVIEKSPDYIIDYPAAPRIASSARNVDIKPDKLKFIVMLRDPIDRAMSEYLEWRSARKSSHKPPLPPFDDMVMLKNGSIDASRPFLIASNYQTHIKHWYEHFNPNQTCFVDGDKFIKDPFSEIHFLEECLLLPPHFTPRHFVFNSKKGFYCFKSSPDQEAAHCMNASKGRKHPDISSSVLEHLRRYYRPFDSQLLPLTGRLMLWQEH